MAGLDLKQRELLLVLAKRRGDMTETVVAARRFEAFVTEQVDWDAAIAALKAASWVMPPEGSADEIVRAAHHALSFFSDCAAPTSAEPPSARRPSLGEQQDDR